MQAAFINDAWRQPFPFIAAVEMHVRRVAATEAKAPQNDAHVKAWRKRVDKLEAAIERPWLHPDISQAESNRLRRRHDPNYKLAERMRNRLRRKGIDGKYFDIIRRAMKSPSGRAGSKVEAFLGYTMADLRRHLERQFSKGMSWHRFSKGEIHIDHIRPLSRFDTSDPDQVREAWALTNLRPLWADANLRRPKDGRDVLL